VLKEKNCVKGVPGGKRKYGEGRLSVIILCFDQEAEHTRCRRVLLAG